MPNTLGEEATGLFFHHLQQQVPASALGYGVQPFGDALLQSAHSAVQAQFPDRAGSVQGNVNAGGLADDFGISDSVLNVISNLVGCANAAAQPAPGPGIHSCGSGPRTGGCDKQCTGFGLVVMVEIDPGLTLPCLSSADPCRSSHAPGDDARDAGEASRMAYATAQLGELLESGDDKCIACEHCDSLSKLRVQGRFAAPLGSVVKAGEVIVNQ